MFKQGRWIGDQMIGTHGFLFKIIPAVIFMFTEPTIYIPYFFHIILNILIAIFAYSTAKKIFDSEKWAALTVFFLINNPLFYQNSLMNAYLRETPALLCLTLLFYLILFRKNFIWILLTLLLAFDAKEYIGIGAVVSFLIYLLIEIISTANRKYFKAYFTFINKSLLIFGSFLIWLFFMYYTPWIPENHSVSSYLGFDLNSAIYKAKFDSDFTTDSLKQLDINQKWNNNRDSIFKVFDNIKYINHIRQTVDYSKLEDEITVKSISANEESYSGNIIKHVTPVKTSKQLVTDNVISNSSNFIKKTIQRITSINAFNYSTFPIFIIVTVILSIVLILYTEKELLKWLFPIILFSLILVIYLSGEQNERYFHPALLSISIFFIYAVKNYLHRRWIVITLLSISLPLSLLQLLFNEFTPTFFVSLVTQILIIPLIWMGKYVKRNYIILIYSIILISNFSYTFIWIVNEFKTEPRGNFEKMAREFSGYFDLKTDSLVYLTQRLYPGRTTNHTIKFYSRSLITMDDASTYVHYVSNKLPKFYLNKYYRQNLFDIYTNTRRGHFLTWEQIKSEYLPKNKINRIVMVVDDKNDWDSLKPVYNKANEFLIDNADKLENRYKSEIYKNFLYNYRPKWLDLIEKHKFGNNRTIYIFRIKDS